MAGYIGSDKSGVIIGGYTNSQIDTAISTAVANAAEVAVSASEPSSPSEGDLWYDSTTGVKILKFYNGTAWLKVSPNIPTLSSISGNIFQSTATTLTLSGTNFLTANLVVNFLQASDSIDVDVTVTPTSQTSATVAVPSSVYDSVTAGNVVSIKVTNSDSQESNAVTKTGVTLPTGGTVTTSGGYRYHEFTSSGAFVTDVELTGVDYIVVAAGGGGGGWGGGGGAGGLISRTSQTLSAATYSIVLGAGGYGNSVAAGYQGAYTYGGDGGDTTFNSLTAIGGGGGGYYDGVAGRSGGSGGGGGGSSSGTFYGVAGGAGTSGQGNNGGRGGGVSTYHNGQGGGGGAGAIGGESAGQGTSGGAGGAGLAPTGFSSFGDSGYFAGGGGGHTDRRNGAAVSTGGSGGGGNGGGYSPNTSAQNGDANTGGGGGGSYGQASDARSGHGGSGTVIIRYPL